MVNINEQIQSWANINPGERFVKEKNTIVVKHGSKVTFWERLTGKARLSHTLAFMIEKVEKNKEALKGSADAQANLASLKGRIQIIQESYHKRHGRLYIWLFGNRVRKQCKTLQNKIDTILSSGTSSEVEEKPQVAPEQQLHDLLIWFKANPHAEATDYIQYSNKKNQLRDLIKTTPPLDEMVEYNTKLLFGDFPGSDYSKFLEGASEDCKRNWFLRFVQDVDKQDAPISFADLVASAINHFLSQEEMAEKKETIQTILDLVVLDPVFLPTSSFSFFYKEISTKAFVEMIRELKGEESLFKFLVRAISTGFGYYAEHEDSKTQKEALVEEVVQHQELVSLFLEMKDADSYLGARPWSGANRLVQQFVFDDLISKIFQNEAYADQYLNLIEKIDPQNYFSDALVLSGFVHKLILIVRHASYAESKKKEILTFVFDKVFQSNTFDETLIEKLNAENNSYRNELLKCLWLYQKEVGNIDQYLDVVIPILELREPEDIPHRASFDFIASLAMAYERLETNEQEVSKDIVLNTMRHLSYNQESQLNIDELYEIFKESPEAWGPWFLEQGFVERMHRELPLNDFIQKANMYAEQANPQSGLIQKFASSLLQMDFLDHAVEHVNDKMLNFIVEESVKDKRNLLSLVPNINPSNEAHRNFLECLLSKPNHGPIVYKLSVSQLESVRRDLLAPYEELWLDLKRGPASRLETLSNVTGTIRQMDRHFLGATFENQLLFTIPEFRQEAIAIINEAAQDQTHNIKPFLKALWKKSMYCIFETTPAEEIAEITSVFTALTPEQLQELVDEEQPTDSPEIDSVEYYMTKAFVEAGERDKLAVMQAAFGEKLIEIASSPEAFQAYKEEMDSSTL